MLIFIEKLKSWLWCSIYEPCVWSKISPEWVSSVHCPSLNWLCDLQPHPGPTPHPCRRQPAQENWLLLQLLTRNVTASFQRTCRHKGNYSWSHWFLRNASYKSSCHRDRCLYNRKSYNLTLGSYASTGRLEERVVAVVVSCVWGYIISAVWINFWCLSKGFSNHVTEETRFWLTYIFLEEVFCNTCCIWFRYRRLTQVTLWHYWLCTCLVQAHPW